MDDIDESKVTNNLTPEQYNICFLKGTEPPGSGKYYHHFEKGIYTCAACDQELFSSRNKYASESGWPSFFAPIHEENLTLKPDISHGMERIEVCCANCGAHLGHVFEDGPDPTGLRFCINSLSLDFKPENSP